MTLGICATLLAGCSNSGHSGAATTTSIAWNNGQLECNGETFAVTSYDGNSAGYVCDEYSIQYMTCSGPDGCIHKITDVNYDDMSEYNGSKYFTAFFDTEMEMYTCIDSKNELWNEGIFGVNGDNSYPVATMASIMEPVLRNLPLNGTVTDITVNDALDIHVSAGNFNVTDSYVVIPGYLKAGMDDGSITFDQTTTIGNTTVACTATAKYTYYGYKDLIIQVAPGVDVTQYVDFL